MRYTVRVDILAYVEKEFEAATAAEAEALAHAEIEALELAGHALVADGPTSVYPTQPGWVVGCYEEEGIDLGSLCAVCDELDEDEAVLLGGEA